MTPEALKEHFKLIGGKLRESLGPSPQYDSALAHPRSKVTKLERALEEYWRRREAGEAIDPDAFCAEHPSVATSLNLMLSVHRYLNDMPFSEKDVPAACRPSPEQPERWPKAGECFLDFDLRQLVGRGRLGRVFLASMPKLGHRVVVVKIALHGGGEAKILGQIKHPNIVPVYSVDEDSRTGLTVVCMPYLGGATLCDLLDRLHIEPKPWARARVILDAAQELPYPLDPSPPGAVAPILKKGAYLDGIRLLGAQLAEALAYLHARNFFHLDLKPSNVLLTPEGTPMILDFNLCSDPERSNQYVGGTFPYMSPEQLRAAAKPPEFEHSLLDARSDIFSLGVILFELLTGVHPFGYTSLKYSDEEIRLMLLERQGRGAPRVRSINPAVDKPLDRLIGRCLSLDPAQRPQSAAELAAALRKDLAPVVRFRRWLRGHPRRVIAAGVVLAAALLLGVAAWAARPPFSERQYARGLELYRQGQYAPAVQCFNDALEAEPNSAPTLFARGRAYLQLGATEPAKYNLALADFAEVNKSAPDGKVEACMGYCLNRLKARDLESASSWYQKALTHGFATAEVYNNLGYCQLRLRELEDAERNLDKAIKLDPRLQAAFENRAVLFTDKILESFPALLSFRPPEDRNQLSPKGKNVPEKISCQLASAVVDIEKATALESGPIDGELSYNAAWVYAIASRIDRNRKKNVLAYLEQARIQKFNLRSVNGDPVFAPFRGEFSAESLNTKLPVPPTRRLVDPVKDHPR